MPRGKIELARHDLEELYVRQGLSQTQVARQLKVSPKTVARRLSEQGIPLRQSLKHPALSRTQMRQLYLADGLTMAQIAERTGTSVGWVQDALRLHGISSRPPGMDRHHRQELPVDHIIHLYVEEGWSAAAVGRNLGVSAPLVLRTLHEHGHRVRRPGRAAGERNDVELVAALYGDPTVRHVLNEHGIPKKRPGRGLVERFPKPVELTRGALRDLYLEAGLSSDHIELLTGQPRLRIRRWLLEEGVPLRSPGDPAPALRRIWGLE